MSDLVSDRKAIAVICRSPPVIWLEFLSGFKDYDTFIIADDNSNDYHSLKIKYPSVQIIQADPLECEELGFANTNTWYFNKVNGWDKTLFYFAHQNTSYDHVWLFEDDVFFYDEETIRNIDLQFPKSDLLTAPYKSSDSSSKDWWWWPKISIAWEPPYYNAMVCGIRASKNLLHAINNYAAENRTLFFLEALFPTVAKKNNLAYHTPKQMVTIYYQYDWKIFSKQNIFHPLKNLALHQKAREAIRGDGFFYQVKFHWQNFYKQTTTNARELIKSILPEKFRPKVKPPDIKQS